MKISQIGIISTAIVISFGILIVIPPYLPQQKVLPVMLFFDIKDSQNLPQWCYDLSATLQKRNVVATIFVTGKIAEKYPECVKILSSRNDIGSQTYNYVGLINLDYDTQLDEVKSGKQAVDKAGNIQSKIFKAPFGSTDQNIYSILNRSEILADFSYDRQYNKYYQGQFLRFDDSVYDGNKHTVNYFRNLESQDPVVIDFDNATPIKKIEEFVSGIKSKHLVFITASKMTGLDLTVHQVGQS
ncbi:MAG: polysaccharide deacetylase [Nitrosopumilales archaeon]|nr:MAG: polysaccharide deacetylase [Nitrosopumilales archaeon]